MPFYLINSNGIALRKFAINHKFLMLFGYQIGIEGLRAEYGRSVKRCGKQMCLLNRCRYF